MRWILVFIFLYMIPLTILFKNYKKFSIACIYGCTYVVLATTIVISNMYISSIRYLENRNSMVMNYKQVYTSNINQAIDSDLNKIKQYKKQIKNTEDIASGLINNCGIYSKDIQTYLDNLKKSDTNIDKAKYMCESVIEIYDDMEVPNLSQETYTNTLQACKKYMKKSYELKYKAIDEIYKSINNKNTVDTQSINKYIIQSNNIIKKYEKEIYELENTIKNR